MNRVGTIVAIIGGAFAIVAGIVGAVNAVQSSDRRLEDQIRALGLEVDQTQFLLAESDVDQYIGAKRSLFLSPPPPGDDFILQLWKEEQDKLSRKHEDAVRRKSLKSGQ